MESPTTKTDVNQRRSVKELKLASRRDIVEYKKKDHALVISKKGKHPVTNSKNIKEVQVTASAGMMVALRLALVGICVALLVNVFWSFQTYRCYWERDFEINITQLTINLENVISQSDAKREFVGFFKNVEDNSFFYKSILCGPPGVGKSLAASLAYKMFPRNHRVLLSTNLLPQAVGESSVLTDVVSRLSCCGKSLIVIENLEYLRENQVPPLLDFLSIISSKNPVCPTRKVFVVMTTADGDEVIEKSQVRGFDDTKSELENYLRNDEVYSRIISGNTNIIPFYALHKEDVEQCFSRLEPDQLRISKALKNLEYYKVNDMVYVEGGCRHVKSLLNIPE